VRAKPVGVGEVQVAFAPGVQVGFLWNPFHDENYVVSWRRIPAGKERDAPWHMREFNSEHEFERAGSKLKTVVEGLPEHCEVAFRVAAVNKYGQSPWSSEVDTQTLLKPSDEGGATGPLGPGARAGARYAWSQSQTEVHARIPLCPEAAARDIRFRCTGARLEVRWAPEGGAAGDAAAEVLAGALLHRVKPDEVFWTVEERDAKLGRHLFVQMVKAEALQKWDCLIDAEDHERIDTRLVRFFKDNMEGLSSLGDLAKIR